jgi:predicted transcriptional regulator
MPKTKTTVYLDEGLIRSVRALAARTGKNDSQVIEDALRSYLGMDVLERAWGSADMAEEDAVRLAVDEARRFRSGAR